MTNSTIKLVQENIRKYRKQKGYTQLQLSLKAGVSFDYIVAIEGGKRTPSLKRLIMIAEALDVEVKDLFE